MNRLLSLMTVIMLVTMCFTTPPATAEILNRTGDYRLVQSDLGGDDNHAIRVTRYYHSAWSEGGMFGPGWTTDYDLRIRHENDGYLSRLDSCTGERVVYKQNDSEDNTVDGTSYSNDSSDNQRIVATKSGYTYSSNCCSESYDSKGLLLSVKHGTDDRVDLVRDKSDRITGLTNGHGQTITFTYDTSGMVTAVQQNQDLVASYNYTPDGHLAGVMVSGKLHYAFEYDKALITHFSTDDEEEWTSYYDSDQPKRVKLFRNSEGIARRYRYGFITPDKLSYVTTMEEKHDGVAIGTFEYKYTEQEEKNGSRWLERFVETHDNEVIRETTYTKFLRPLEITSYGNSIVYKYDSLGRVIRNEYPQAVYEYTYDPASGKVSGVHHTVHGEEGEEVRDTYFAYDANRNLIKVCDSRGTVLKLSYDNSNMISVIEKGDTTIKFSYEVHGKPERIEWVGVGTIDAIYDDHGEIKSVSSDKGRVVGLKVTEVFMALRDMTKEAEVQF